MSGQGPERGQRGAGELAANVLRSLIVAPPAGVGAPAWVRRVLERGLAVEPWARWPTMDELLAALGRDPQRARRRWLAAATLVTAIAGAGYGAAVTRSVEAEVCSGASDALAAVWGADRRAAVELALRATGVVYAERAAVASGGLLDDFAGRWISAHTAACVSHRRGEMSAQLFDRKMACLRQRRAELAATAEVLAQTTRDSAAQAAAAALTASTPTIKEGAPDSAVVARGSRRSASPADRPRARSTRTSSAGLSARTSTSSATVTIRPSPMSRRRTAASRCSS